VITKNPNNSPDLSALAAWAGDNQDRLLTALYTELDLAASGITVIPNLKSKMTLHQILVRKGLKPYTGIHKPKPDIHFKPRTLEVNAAQRDLAIEPKKYLQTFMEKRRGTGENAKNMTIPFADIMWNEVIRELKDELVNDTFYRGVGEDGFPAYNAGTAYPVGGLMHYVQDGEDRYFEAVEATLAGQNPDTHPLKWKWAGGRAVAVGFKKILDDAETAGDIVPVSTGAITSADAYGQITSVWRAVDERIRRNGANIYMSHNTYEALLDDMENKVHKNFETLNNMTFLSKTDKKGILKPVDWLAGSGKVIVSASGNLWMGTDQTNDWNVIKTIEQMYHIDAGITFMIGFQVADFNAMATNDQD
jgi:hypothetical protein